MANLLISEVCNQRCSYCFAIDHRARTKSRGRFLDIGDFELRLDFLDRSRIDEVRLLGGEPTLHPQFCKLIERARSRGKRIVVFSNGLMPERSLKCLETLSPSEVCVLLNVGPNEHGQASRKTSVIRRLGERCLLSFNICRPDFKPDFLLGLIAETGCRKTIRVGMAQPCLSGRNVHVRPKQYTLIGAKIENFARCASEFGVVIELDCGFVRCMFSDDGVSMLKASRADVAWRCNPILDIDIDGQIFHCYPLANLDSLPLASSDDALTARSVLATRTRHYRQAGVFPECSTCRLKWAGECSGGCLAATIRRFHLTSFRLTVPFENVASDQCNDLSD